MPKKYYSPLKKIFLALLLFSTACVDPYTKQFTGEETIFVVDGRLTNMVGNSYVKLTESTPGANSTTFLPVKKANVKIQVDNSTYVNLTETDSGYYSFPKNFAGKVGSTYQLQLNTANGMYFESRVEEMGVTPEISNVSHEFVPDAIKNEDGFFGGQKIFVNVKDPGDTKNFYLWDWKLYEKQFHCISCYEGLYYRNPPFTPPNGECRTLIYAFDWYDYLCEKACWEIYHSDKINIMDDEFSNGKEIKGRLVADIPVYQPQTGSLIEIRQYGISKPVYDYLKLAQAQGQDTGGLADTPPATLSGNISSPNDPTQPVGGYFIVSSATKATHWLNKSDLPLGTRGIGLFVGRRIREEPTDVYGEGRPPIAPCLESETRTSYMPEGWEGN